MFGHKVNTQGIECLIDHKFDTIQINRFSSTSVFNSYTQFYTAL